MVEQREQHSARQGVWPLRRAGAGFGAASSRPPRRAARLVWSSCYIALGCLALALIVGGLFVARLAQGPITISGLGAQIASALDQRFGRGYDFRLGQASIVKRGYAPTLSIDGLALKDAAGKTILTAPRAEVSVDLLSLFAGRVTPKRLEIFDVELHMALMPDGSLALPAAPESKDAVPFTPPLADALAQGSLAPQKKPGPFAAASAAPANSEPSATRPRALIVKQMAASIRLMIDSLTNPESPIAAVDRVGIARGRVVIDDRTADQTMVFNGVSLGFDKSSRATTFNLSVDGPNGRWEASGLASGLPGAERRLALSLRNLSLDEILLATGARSIGADFDMPVSAKINFAVNADGSLSEAAGAVDFGAGYLRFDDPNDEPMLVDLIHGGFHWDGAARRILIDRSRLVSGGTHAAISGFVAPPVREGDPWAVEIVSAEPNIAAPERPGQKPVEIDRGELKGRLLLAEKKFLLDRFSFSGPECGFAMAGEVEWTNGPHMRLGASMSPTPVAVVTRLWPSFMVAPVRSYLTSHVRGGIVQKATLQLDFNAAVLAGMRAEHPPPDDTVALDFTVTDGSLDFLAGVPYLRGVDGVGHVTGRSSTFTTTSTGFIDAGEGRRLTILEGGSFHVADAALKPTPAMIVAKVSSSVEAVGDLLSREALKPFASLPLDQSTLKGQVDGKLEIDMSLGPNMGPNDISLKINAAVTNFSAENLIGKERLEDATLAVTVDPAGLRASGQGRMFGSPATIDMVRPEGKTADASINLILDDAARAKHNISILPGLTGPIGATLRAPLGGGEKLKAQVELDLTHAAFDWLGMQKPAGKPGKAKLSLVVNENSTSLDQIVVDAGAIQARGAAELAADQSLSWARLAQLKASSGDEMKLEATRAGDILKVMIRGATIDARPVLKWLIAASPDPIPPPAESKDKDKEKDAPPIDAGAVKDAGPKEVELDLKTGLLTGYNKEVVTGAELHLVRGDNQLKQFSFAGRFGREPVSGNLTNYPAAPQINFLSDDAGSLLSFVDLYKHMEGGRLSVAMRVSPGVLDGGLEIESFVLRDEPALRRMVAEGVPSSEAAHVKKIDVGSMAFAKLQVKFERAGSRVELREGTMHGESIGLTVDGWIDYAHDRVDMRGTFVPVYSVNNLFSKIPVFGMILGGGANEGLIGVNFRVEGAVSAPTLNINPLSAIAPGIFRQIFGVGANFPPSGAVRE